MMTVGELVEKLKQFPNDLRVVTPGFDESNLDDVGTVDQVWVAFHDGKTPGHVGRHVEVDPIETSKPFQRAVIINF